MYWGDEYVPIRQARRALMTWLGDPRTSKQRATETAREVLGQINSPQATPHARQELLEVLTEAAYTGRPDFERLERAIRAVFEPDFRTIRRAIGHISAPVSTEAIVNFTRARLTAVAALTDGNVTDEALMQARDSHLFAYADYAARQPFLAAVAPPGIPQLYAPVTGEDTLNQSCRHLLSALGLEILYPATAERLRQERAGSPQRGNAAFGLAEDQITDQARRAGKHADR